MLLESTILGAAQPEIERQIGRHTDRQTDTQTDRNSLTSYTPVQPGAPKTETGRQTDRQTDAVLVGFSSVYLMLLKQRQRDRQTDLQTTDIVLLG